MIRVNLLEPSLLDAVREGKKTQVTFLWPSNFTNQGNDIALYYPDGEDLHILGVAKIQNLVKIKGGIIPAGSSYDAADLWAQAEGFKDFWEACKWFSAKYGEDWQNRTWGILQFKGGWGV